MKKENLFLPFEVRIRQYDCFPVEMHQHSFYELCYVLSGMGQFLSKELHSDFKTGSLFLVSPGVDHTYQLMGMCKLVFVRLSDYYLERAFGTMGKESFTLLVTSDLVPFFSPVDRRNLALLMECIVAEYNVPSFDTPRLVECWVNSILLMCVRSIRHQVCGSGKGEEQESRFMSLLHYIQLHLASPELLRVRNLSRQFNLSANYIGRFFKVHTGTNMQEYILQCRMNAVIELLMVTDMRIKEIALKTGFADVSHLTHTFKRIKGMTPLEYRKHRNRNVE